MAEALHVFRQMRFRCLEVERQHPTKPFVGGGRLVAEDQRMRARERTVRNLQAENAILKKPCASSPTVRSKVRVH